MQDSTLTSEVFEPYAQGLMSLAQAQNLTDRFGDDAAGILTLLADSDELGEFLANPIIKPEQKKAVLQQVLGDQVHTYMKNFLLLLVDRRRIGFLVGILKQYQNLLRALKQAVLAEVTATVELSEAQQQQVREKVMAMTGAQQVDLETRIDPDLIGGVVIKVGSQIVDASLRGQLRRISLRLMSPA